MNIDEFLSTYNPNNEHDVITIDVAERESEYSRFIHVKHGKYEVVLSVIPLSNHLCIDVHSFVDGEDATAGVFGMSDGQRSKLSDLGTTSHNWPSAHLVAVCVGEQGVA